MAPYPSIAHDVQHNLSWHPSETRSGLRSNQASLLTLSKHRRKSHFFPHQSLARYVTGTASGVDFPQAPMAH
jgi:hypothetical protein